MNRSFLEIYNTELRHIRQTAAEFGQEYPDIAGKLHLDPQAAQVCQDPFVERLLEGFAFMAARVQLKLESEYPTFTQGLLETAYPDYLAPLPSASVVCFEPKANDPLLLTGPRVNRLTELKTLTTDTQQVSCKFRTAHNVPLYPLEVSVAQYHYRDVADLTLNVFESREGKLFPDVRAALRLRLRLIELPEKEVKHLECPALSFFINGTDHLPSVLLEEIFAHGLGAVVAEPGDHRHKRSTVLPTQALRHAGFEENEAMLPQSPQSFEGHRILREHFLLPQRNQFLEISQLEAAIKKLNGREFDLIIPLSEYRSELESFVSPSVFKLFATPVINLFSPQPTRIPLRPSESEHLIIIDPTKMQDHEVYSVSRVEGFEEAGGVGTPFYPFYLRPIEAPPDAGFYTLRRSAITSPKDEATRNRLHGRKYLGDDVFVQLTRPPTTSGRQFREISVKALCTNRHHTMPGALRPAKGSVGPAFSYVDEAPVTSIQCLIAPSPPRPSTISGRQAWAAVNHLTLNYLSLVGKATDDKTPSHAAKQEGVAPLRELLRLYTTDQSSTSLLEGIRGISSRPGICRSPGTGPITFIRGLDIELVLNEDRLVGQGVFLLASVLEQFFARHVSINSFARLTLKAESSQQTTHEPRHVLQWPARVGKIPIG